MVATLYTATRTLGVGYPTVDARARKVGAWQRERPLYPACMRRIGGFWAILLALASAGGCGGDEDVAVETRRAELAEGCAINTDCTSPLVCAFRKCHVQCTSSRDCTAGQLCVASDKPFYVCQLPSETKCQYNSQCAGDQVCGVDGKCREQCANEKDCLPGQRCAQATCAEPTEVDAANKLPVVNPGAGGALSGNHCNYAADCATGQVCRNGACMAECLDDRDCVSPKTCRLDDLTCVLPPPADGTPVPKDYGKGCNVSSDCTKPLVCGKSGLCSLECSDGGDCASGCCSAHRCVDAAMCGGTGGAAGSGGSGGAGTGGSGGTTGGSAGTTTGGAGGASGASGTGGTGGTVGGPCDLDADGYKSMGACGGNDCDDGNPDVHPGGKELCDGLDNNCNGEIDENVWVAGVPVELFESGSYPLDGYMPGPPGIAVLPGSPARVFVVGGDAGARVVFRELDETLAGKGTTVALHTVAGTYVGRAGIATDGSTLAVAAYSADGANALRGATFSPSSPPSSLPMIASGHDYWSNARVVWTGTRFAIVWTDSHDAGIRLYRSVAQPGGPFGLPAPVFADTGKQVGVNSWIPSHVTAVGPSSVALLVHLASGTLTHELFDPDVVTPGGTTDLKQDVYPTGLTALGTDWIGVVRPTTTSPTVVRLSAGGALLGSRDFPAGDGNSTGAVLAVGTKGVLLAYSFGSSIKVGFLPPDLGTKGDTDPANDAPIQIYEIPSGAATSPPALARIDDKHFIVVWQDGKAKGSILTCVQ